MPGKLDRQHGVSPNDRFAAKKAGFLMTTYPAPCAATSNCDPARRDP
jgi:hypothetical protein